jgi:hypothetical protein
MTVEIVLWDEDLQTQTPCPRPGCGGILRGISLYAFAQKPTEPFFSGWQCSSCPRVLSVPSDES